MNAQTNAVSDSRFESEAIADSPTRPTRPFFWSVRRELWENRSIYIVPLIAAGFIILAALVGSVPGNGIVIAHNGRAEHLAVPQQLEIVSMVIMGVTLIVAVFYCLDAFYGERRDRSILFWKSLPVSDTTATLAKATIPLVVVPVVTFVIAAVTQWIVLAIDAASLAAHGGTLGHVPMLQMQAGLLYHLITVHSLWYAPIFAWFLLVSAFAPKAPILWAVLPPIFIEILESIAFHTSYFSRFLSYRFAGAPAGDAGGSMDMSGGPAAGMTPGHFLASPGLWSGLLLAAIFLTAAVQLRRYRSPS